MSARKPPVSVREFARLDGCDESLVRRAIKSGKLAASADGKIDPKFAGTGWRRQNRRAAEAADKPADTAPPVRKPRRRRGETSIGEDELAAAIDQIVGTEGEDFVAGVLDGRFKGTWEAERIKENALAAKHLLAARKEAGNLVEIEVAEAVLFEASRAARDAWMSFPTKIGPLLAADLGVDSDRVVEALTAHVQDQLEQLGEPEGSFADR